MKKIIYLLAFFPLLLVSCEEESQVDGIFDDVETRNTAYSAYISGNTIVTKGSQETYYLNNVPINANVTWQLLNAHTISKNDRSITIKFENTGTINLCAEIVHMNTIYTTRLNILVIDPYKISIAGPTNAQVGESIKYSLNDPGNGYSYSSVAWYLDDTLISNKTILNYTFALKGDYTLKCSGFVVKDKLSIPFTKTIHIGITGNNLELKGESIICSSSQESYNITNLPKDASVFWSLDNNVASIVSGQNTPAIKLKKNKDGSTMLTAKITFSSGTEYKATKKIEIGLPSRPHLLTSTLNTSAIATYKLYYGSPTTSLPLSLVDPENMSGVYYTVQKTVNPSNFDLLQWEQLITVNPRALGAGQFTVRSHNRCGQSTSVTTVNLDIQKKKDIPKIDPPSLPTD